MFDGEETICSSTRNEQVSSDPIEETDDESFLSRYVSKKVKGALNDQSFENFIRTLKNKPVKETVLAVATAQNNQTIQATTHYSQGTQANLLSEISDSDRLNKVIFESRIPTQTDDLLRIISKASSMEGLKSTKALSGTNFNEKCASYDAEMLVDESHLLRKRLGLLQSVENAIFKSEFFGNELLRSDFSAYNRMILSSSCVLWKPNDSLATVQYAVCGEAFRISMIHLSKNGQVTKGLIRVACNTRQSKHIPVLCECFVDDVESTQIQVKKSLKHGYITGPGMLCLYTASGHTGVPQVTDMCVNSVGLDVLIVPEQTYKALQSLDLPHRLLSCYSLMRNRAREPRHTAIKNPSHNEDRVTAW